MENLGEVNSNGKRPATVEKLILKIVSQDREVVEFLLSSETKFRTVFKEYCKEKNLEYDGTIRFLYDGQLVKPTDTPAKFGIEDGDIIDAMVENTGGGF